MPCSMARLLLAPLRLGRSSTFTLDRVVERIVLVALIGGSLMVGSGRVACAEAGALPDEGSGGFGRAGTTGNRAAPFRPGAREARLIKPGHPGKEGACTAGGSGSGVIVVAVSAGRPGSSPRSQGR